MRRLGSGVLGGAALFLAAGCDSGTAETVISMKFDGGTDAGVVTVIFEDAGPPPTPPDGAAACPTGLCNYQTSTGCPAGTPACIPVVSGGVATPACSPAGAGKTGAACTMQSDCAAGYLCVSGANECRKLCCGGDWSGCDSADQHCLQALDYGDGMGGVIVTGAMLCAPVNNCSALDPTSCTKPGTACLIADATGATACLTPGSGGTGDPCPCQGGFACVTDTPGAAPVCHRLCGAVAGGAPPYCQDGEGVCIHHGRDPEGVGECRALTQ
jgi:hypothetical protein